MCLLCHEMQCRRLLAFRQEGNQDGYSKPQPLSTGNLVARNWAGRLYFSRKGHHSSHLRSPTDTSSHPQ